MERVKTYMLFVKVGKKKIGLSLFQVLASLGGMQRRKFRLDFNGGMKELILNVRTFGRYSIHV